MKNDNYIRYSSFCNVIDCIALTMNAVTNLDALHLIRLIPWQSLLIMRVGMFLISSNNTWFRAITRRAEADIDHEIVAKAVYNFICYLFSKSIFQIMVHLLTTRNQFFSLPLISIASSPAHLCSSFSIKNKLSGRFNLFLNISNVSRPTLGVIKTVRQIQISLTRAIQRATVIRST